MKSTNGAWNMCVNQCNVSVWLFRAKLVKGDNSGRYKIIDNEREIRDVVYQKPQSVF